MALIGIDLGTTNSLVSYWTDEGVKIIPNVLGSNLTPSVISVDDGGEILVGEIAKQRLITHPNETVAVFKRFMGTRKTFQLGKHEFLPEELSSFVIRSLKKDAEIFMEEPVEEAVISVPAYFNDTQRKATKRAGELAGLKVERIINEPTAAAIAYGLHKEEDETKFLVFDLGGGTFDVSILELFENVMEVKSIAGDNYLGGEDFTGAIFKRFLEQNNLDEKSLDAKLSSSIWKQAEICKRQLSEDKNGSISCSVNDQTFEWTINLSEFEEITKQLLSRLRLPIERAMRDADLSADEIDNIILVGGATRMPLIRSFVSKLFGRLPAVQLNPDEAVAMGAGIQSGMKSRDAAIREIVLTDVCPYTLGTDIAVRTDAGYKSGHYCPIIERNTVIPVSRSERLYTVHDYQKRIKIGIYQGENRHVADNIKLGELMINVRPAPAGEQAVDIRYTYDINGILEVEVTNVESGEKQRIVLEENPGNMSKEEIEKRLKALESIKIHPRDKAENRLLIARGERLYEESLKEMRDLIGHALLRFENALDTQDNKIIKNAVEELKSLYGKIETGEEF